MFNIGSENPTNRAMYMETNRIARKWSEIAFDSLVIVSPICLNVPKVLVVYWIYFTSALGNDAFELPFPMW